MTPSDLFGRIMLEAEELGFRSLRCRCTCGVVRLYGDAALVAHQTLERRVEDLLPSGWIVFCERETRERP